MLRIQHTAKQGKILQYKKSKIIRQIFLLPREVDGLWTHGIISVKENPRATRIIIKDARRKI